MVSLSAEPGPRRADYSLSEEQESLRDAFATFFERECTSERVREAEPTGFDPHFWKRLNDMRMVAMGVPESAGGRRCIATKRRGELLRSKLVLHWPATFAIGNTP